MTVRDLVSRLGNRARAGTPAQAAAFGEMVFVAVPFLAWPDLARELAAALAGKVVIDAGNPYPQRDGVVVDSVNRLGRGSGAYVAGRLPGSSVVKAFNTLYYETLAKEADRKGERLAVPVAGNEADAVARVARLVDDAGFDAVALNSIDRARDFDVGHSHTTSRCRPPRCANHWAFPRERGGPVLLHRIGEIREHADVLPNCMEADPSKENLEQRHSQSADCRSHPLAKGMRPLSTIPKLSFSFRNVCRYAE